MFFRKFFYLQKSDRKAVLVLLCLAVIALVLVFVTGNQFDKTSISSVDSSSSQLLGSSSSRNTNEQYYQVDAKKVELFPFDPNTADSTQLLRLGLAPFQVRSIYRYRAKGGVYRQPEDFARLFGLSKKQYEMLAPYIRISDDYRPASDFYGSSRSSYSNSSDSSRSNHAVYNYSQKLKMGERISVNSADTTQLKKIPGIGIGYAKAIVRYRERLGGFANANQLLEIDGVPSSALDYVKVNSSEIHRLNVNQLNLNQLRKHPYINFYQAREICDYRRLKGPLKSLNDLRLLKDFPPAEIEKLSPYVCF